MDWRLEVHAALPSTSDLCIAQAEADAPAGLAILAHRQTKGRGSRGRDWQSPNGNLSLSILLRPDEQVARSGAWPLLIGLAVTDALQPLLPDPSALQLKWPNDVLLHGRKIGGILIDIAADAQGRLRWLVIGCGVNLATAPALPDRATACLRDAGITPPAPEDFARTLLAALTYWMDRYATSALPEIHAAWLARAHPPGTALRVTYGGNTLEGHFAGLSPEGFLLLRTTAGTQAIASGEVLLAPR